MALTPPTAELTALEAGNTATWTKEFDDFSPADGYVLSYRLVARNGLTAINISSTTSGTGFLINVPAATTAGWAAGDYTLIGFITKSPDRFQVYKDSFTISPDPASVDFLDSRTYWETVLDDLKQLLKPGGLIRAPVRFTYNSVSTEVHTVADAIKWIQTVEAIIAQEAAIATGTQQKILTRFVNPR